MWHKKQTFNLCLTRVKKKLINYFNCIKCTYGFSFLYSQYTQYTTLGTCYTKTLTNNTVQYTHDMNISIVKPTIAPSYIYVYSWRSVKIKFQIYIQDNDAIFLAAVRVLCYVGNCWRVEKELRTSKRYYMYIIVDLGQGLTGKAVVCMCANKVWYATNLH